MLVALTSSPSWPPLFLIGLVPGAAIRAQERGCLCRPRGDVSTSRRGEFQAGGKVESQLGLDADHFFCWFLPTGPRMAPQIRPRTAVHFNCPNLLCKSPCRCFWFCRNKARKKTENTSRRVFREGLEVFWDKKGEVLLIHQIPGPPSSLHCYHH